MSHRNNLYFPILALVAIIVTNFIFQDLFLSKYSRTNSLYATLSGLRSFQNVDNSLELLFAPVSVGPESQSVFNNVTSSIPPIKPKIAFIFAGSARSFVCEKVHWSIRSHLIDSFNGESYVFVRIAIDDNKNIKTGLGTLWTPPYKDNEVNETLKVLSPRVIQYFSFKNQIQEMEENYPGLDHAVFRENDRRRYSMFFHRCMAYKLMTKYEIENSIKFDWVVLVRLDAVWLEPVLPINSYQNDRVWITETGFDLFNDQFMLMPRQFSDYLYDLNTKVKSDVYCLGGPDVEKWKCKKEELVKRGVQSPMLEKTLERCCSDVFSGDRRGASERIHFRHLRNGNIPVSTGRFPVALVRRRADTTCFVECFRLYTYQYKEYLFRFNGSLYPLFKPPVWPDTRGRTISARDKVACVMLDSGNFFEWQPPSALSLHTSHKITHLGPVNYSQNLYDQVDRLHPSVLMNPKDLEAWRIHPTFNVDGCLTFSYTHKNLSWDHCNDHVSPHSLRYDPRQIFFLQVIPESPSEYDFSYRPQTQLLPSHSTPITRNWTRVIVTDANMRDWEPRHPIQCLTAIRTNENSWEKAVVTTSSCSVNKMHPSQLFHSVAGWTSGSVAFSTVGSVRFAADPKYCVTRMDDKEKPAEFLTAVGGNFLHLGPCEPGGLMHQVMFEFELVRS